MSVHGGCLCGAVRYALAQVPTTVYLCYCGQCRKAQGTPFVASVPVARADFTLTQGAAHLRAYRATASKARYFCAECGSPLYSEVDGADVLRLRAGSLDGNPSLTIAAHIYTADRVTWYPIQGDQPKYSAREPGRR
jgi:hypothetical protein